MPPLKKAVGAAPAKSSRILKENRHENLIDPDTPSSDRLDRVKSFYKRVEPVLVARTDFAQISATAQFRTSPAGPHRIAQVFLPSVAGSCLK